MQPAGWLFCDGSEFLRTGAGLALFNVIGTTYGVGNGSTTANLPDLRGRVPVGAPGATGRIPTGYFGGFSSLAIGAVGGQAIHSLEETELPPHVHTLTDPGHGHSQTQSTHLHTYNRPTVSYTVNAGVQQAVWTAAVTSDTTSPNNANVSAIAANFTGITMGSIGSGLDFNIMQPSLLINTYIIKL